MPVRISRVFAMARPRRPAGERELIEGAFEEIEAQGSTRARTRTLAARVAQIAVAQLGDDEMIGHLKRLAVAVETPALASLALDPEGAAMRCLVVEAVAEFEARGCRHAPAEQWPSIDAAIAERIGARLAERYRSALK